MTPEQQRIAVAEARGIKHCEWHVQCFGPTLFKGEKNGTLVNVPSYLTDLNAMHEALHFLTDKEHGKFRSILVEVVNGTKGIVSLMSDREYRAWFEATSAQKAEAFLKTIGKWLH